MVILPEITCPIKIIVSNTVQWALLAGNLNFSKFVNKHGHFFSKVLAKYSSYKLIVGQKIGKLYLLNVCYLTKRMTSWNKVIISNLCFTSGLNMDVDKELEALFILSKDPMHYITVVEVRRIAADPWLIREVNLEHRLRIHSKAGFRSNDLKVKESAESLDLDPQFSADSFIF